MAKNPSRVARRAERGTKELGEAKNSYRRTILRQELNATIFRLRCKGWSVSDIAAELELNPHAVSNSLSASLKEYKALTASEADNCRQFELARLDNMLRALQPKIEQGDVPSIQAGIKLIERRCKLLGLDAPTKVDIAEQPNTALAREKLLALLG